MTREWRLEGRVVRGAGQAAYFTRVDWVQEQCAHKLGFAPYPGTLNLQVFENYIPTIEALQGQAGIPLVPPTDEFCSANTLPATIGGIRGALIVPEKQVQIHGESIVEFIAPIRLKKALGLRDGDRVEIVVHAPYLHGKG